MSTSNAILIGRATARSRSLDRERRPPGREACAHARTPIPRRIPLTRMDPGAPGRAAFLVAVGRRFRLNERISLHASADGRPAAERTGAGRYQEPSLLD